MIPILACRVLGLAFLIVGVWGLFTGDSILGVFTVNMAHNVVHLASGAAALACGFGGVRIARMFCIIFGAVYLLVAVLGFIGVQAVIDLLRLNTADHWLHAALALAFLVAGLAGLPAARGAVVEMKPVPR